MPQKLELAAKLKYDGFKNLITKKFPLAYQLQFKEPVGLEHVAARAAVFDVLSPHGDPAVQMQHIYGQFQKFAINLAYEMLRSTASDKEQGLRIRRIEAMCRCCPAGGYTCIRPSIDGSFPSDAGPRFFRHACDRDLICPWCHYRNFLRIYRDLESSQGKSVSTYSVVFEEVKNKHGKVKNFLTRTLRRNFKSDLKYVLVRPATQADMGTRISLMAVDSGDLDINLKPFKGSKLVTTEASTSTLGQFLQDTLPKLYAYEPLLMGHTSHALTYISESANGKVNGIARYPRRSKKEADKDLQEWQNKSRHFSRHDRHQIAKAQQLVTVPVGPIGQLPGVQPMGDQQER